MIQYCFNRNVLYIICYLKFCFKQHTSYHCNQSVQTRSNNQSLIDDRINIKMKRLSFCMQPPLLNRHHHHRLVRSKLLCDNIFCQFSASVVFDFFHGSSLNGSCHRAFHFRLPFHIFYWRVRRIGIHCLNREIFFMKNKSVR